MSCIKSINKLVSRGSYLDLLLAYLRLNLRSQLQYRAAFMSQAVGMIINNFIWIAFWCSFFTRFPTLKDWTGNDIVALWSIVAAGFGVAHSIFGNAIILPRLIMRGELDTWKLYPRALLPHLLLGSTCVTSWGDIVFGFAAYGIFVRPDPAHFALFTLLVLSIAIAFVGFSILSGSLAFFVGNGESLSENWRFAVVTFSCYPSDLFKGWIKVLLFTIIPAGICGYLPVDALRNFSLAQAGLSLLGSLTLLAVGSAVFYFGLSRYESGNLMEMRG